MLNHARDAALSARRTDRADVIRKHRGQLLALQAITRAVAHNQQLSRLSELSLEEYSLEDSEEAVFLKANDISNGCYFNDTSIPFPSITRHDDSISSPKPNRLTGDLPNRVEAPAEVEAAAQSTSSPAPLDTSSSDDSMKLRSGIHRSSERSDGDNDASQTTVSLSRASQHDEQIVQADDATASKTQGQSHVADETQLPSAGETSELPLKQSNDAQPPARDAERQEPRDRVQPPKPSATQLHTNTEPASSPSSTVGPYSAATPLPPQDSPDTSPDSESADQPEEALTPKDLQPSPEARREKEEHDRLLEAQKEIARKQALGDVSDPNDQLLWEEREAAARAAEEQRAHESVGGPEPDSNMMVERTAAEEVADEMDVDGEVETVEALKSGDKREVPRPLAATDEDGDNIVVTPRVRAPLTVATTQPQTPATTVEHLRTPPAEPQSAAVPESSAPRKRTASEAFAHSRVSKDEVPSSAVSPMTIRHPQDSDVPLTSLRTPRRPPPVLSSRRPHTPNNAQAVVEELQHLRGAAEDPDRDYLESLFRIQAHDSPNIRSTALHDLVRSASKALSTADQFTASHERLEYRALRKIYTLQNANKWTLRQMEKAKEPPQPVTHHDHMMAEMRWMRKDFRAERKLKKSVCKFLAEQCANWVSADAGAKQSMQVKIRPPTRKASEDHEEQPPELEHSGESAAEDEANPPTPRLEPSLPVTLIVPPELSSTVASLQEAGKLQVALRSLPASGWQTAQMPHRTSLDPTSKFVKGTVLPATRKPKRKRSKFDYPDDDEVLRSERAGKRNRSDRDLPPEDQEIALFHPDNKPIRDRLHANNTFRPPSEFVMPSTQFYEFRNGSQWVQEDDQKLRKLAKEYSFNWSLISDELTLPASYKSSAERRTPWECFERWVELEQLPAEMKKTMYFKTWFTRLETSQQAADRRYQAQVTALQAANGQQAHIPTRRRTIPTRVEKRKNTRYLWLVDAMRKLARKKEATAYKQAEAQRAAAQRKTQSTDANPHRATIKTPKEFSKMRQDLDAQQAERMRLHRQKLLEAQSKQAAAQRQAMQQGHPGQHPRPGSSSNMPAQQAHMQANGQPPNMSGQQGRQQVPLATRNGHLAVPQVNAQGIPQAQMRPNGHMQNPQDMQRIAHANAQAQARGAQYGGQQQQYAQMQHSPGAGAMNHQQQGQSSQALHAAMQQPNGQHAYQQPNNHQMSGSPSMPPPPTPQNAHKQLSSGHIPAIVNIKAQLRQKYPQATDQQIQEMSTELLMKQQSANSARQSAMNAAAGIDTNTSAQPHGNMQQAYAQNQAAFQGNQQMRTGVPYPDGDGSHQQTSPQQQQQYAAAMRARQMQQMGMQQSPGMSHASVNGSPSMANPSPAPVSPSMQFAAPNGTPQMTAAQLSMGQRPPSRSATPQMQRLGSSGSLQQGMPSPGAVNGLQGSPRSAQANMAR